MHTHKTVIWWLSAKGLLVEIVEYIDWSVHLSFHMSVHWFVPCCVYCHTQEESVSKATSLLRTEGK